jgi:hypothetical protein
MDRFYGNDESDILTMRCENFSSFVVIYMSPAAPVYSLLPVLATPIVLRIDNGSLTMGT